VCVCLRVGGCMCVCGRANAQRLIESRNAYRVGFTTGNGGVCVCVCVCVYVIVYVCVCVCVNRLH